MNKSLSILIAEGLSAQNKGALELIEGILKTFDILGQAEVKMFSFYPELDCDRYPKRVELIDICKDLRIERFMPGGSPGARVRPSATTVLLSSVLAGVQHLFFVLLYKLFGKKTLALMRKPLWKNYCSSDIFIICLNEDDLVRGNYITYTPVFVSILAKTLGKLTIVYAQSNVQLNSRVVWLWRLQSGWLWKVLARYLLSNLDLITTRDRDTFELYRSLAGSRIPLHFTGDVGILMEPAESIAVKRILAKEKINDNDGLLVGVSISRRLLSYSFAEISDSNKRYERGISEIARVFDRLIAECRASIVVVPHCVEYTWNEDDRDVGNDILKEMKNKANFKVITKEYTAQELKGLMGKLDVLVGDRIHALLSALSMNVPCCALTHKSDKRHCNLVGKDFRQEKWIFEVDNFDVDRLYNLLTDLVASSEEIRKSLPPLVQRAKERALLNGELLKALLSNRELKNSCPATSKT